MIEQSLNEKKSSVIESSVIKSSMTQECSIRNDYQLFDKSIKMNHQWSEHQWSEHQWSSHQWSENDKYIIDEDFLMKASCSIS